MAMIVNDPSLVIRSVLSVVTASVAVGAIVSVIAVGVFVSKIATPFSTSEVVVLRSPTTIVLNRFILPIEVPLFYDVLETMNVSVADIKTVLTARFGSKFVTVQFLSFSATPNVTSKNAKGALTRGDFRDNLEKESVVVMGTEATSTGANDMARAIKETNNCDDSLIYVTECSLNDKEIYVCKESNGDALPCAEKGNDRIKCVENVTASRNCSCAEELIIHCKNITLTLPTCLTGASATFCESLHETTSSTSTLSAALTTSSTVSSISTTNSAATVSTISITTSTTMISQTSITSSATLASTTSTTTSTLVPSTSASTTAYSVSSSTPVSMTTAPCENPANGTGQTSIIISRMLLFFKVNEGETILVEDIIDALSSLNTPIALLTTCGQASTQNSSFNRTLSRVEQPVRVNVDPVTLTREPSISASLAADVQTEAETAAGNLTTTTLGTPSPIVTPQLIG